MTPRCKALEEWLKWRDNFLRVLFFNEEHINNRLKRIVENDLDECKEPFLDLIESYEKRLT